MPVSWTVIWWSTVTFNYKNVMSLTVNRGNATAIDFMWAVTVWENVINFNGYW